MSAQYNCRTAQGRTACAPTKSPVVRAVRLQVGEMRHDFFHQQTLRVCPALVIF